MYSIAYPTSYQGMTYFRSNENSLHDQMQLLKKWFLLLQAESLLAISKESS